MDFKLATFNLKHDYLPLFKTYWSKRKTAVREFFVEESPDIVGTQELCQARINELIHMLPEYCYIGVGRGGGQTGEFSAIFYKQKTMTCLDQGTFWLSEHPDRVRSRGFLAMFPRVCTWGLFSLFEGTTLAVFNTHLDHISPFARRRGLVQISEFIQQRFPDVPCVLMGDFNAKPHSKTLRSLKMTDRENVFFTNDSYHAFYHKDPERGKTYHAFRGGVKGTPIDYIFTSKQIVMKDICVVQKKFAGQYPSDHFPIIMNCTVVHSGQEKINTDRQL